MDTRRRALGRPHSRIDSAVCCLGLRCRSSPIPRPSSLLVHPVLLLLQLLLPLLVKLPLPLALLRRMMKTGLPVVAPPGALHSRIDSAVSPRRVAHEFFLKVMIRT